MDNKLLNGLLVLMAAVIAPLLIVTASTVGASFLPENQAGAATLKAKRRIGREHPIEIVGAKLRGMMSWINEGKIVDKNVN